jgi:hypothetical protein
MKIKTADIKEYQLEYRKKNKEKLDKRSKEWRRRNGIMPRVKKEINIEEERKRRRKKSLQYYRKNKEKFSSYARDYYLKNKEKQIARGKARSINIPLGQICELCEKRLAEEKHHKDYGKPHLVLFVCVICHNKL